MNDPYTNYKAAAAIILQARDEVAAKLDCGLPAFIDGRPVPAFHGDLRRWDASAIPENLLPHLQRHRSQLTDGTHPTSRHIVDAAPAGRARWKETVQQAWERELSEIGQGRCTEVCNHAQEFTSFDIFAAFLQRRDPTKLENAIKHFENRVMATAKERFPAAITIDQLRGLVSDMTASTSPDFIEAVMRYSAFAQRFGIFETPEDAALVQLYARLLAEKGPNRNNVRLWFNDIAMETDTRVTSNTQGLRLLHKIMGRAMRDYFDAPKPSNLIPPPQPVPADKISLSFLNSRADATAAFRDESRGTALTEPTCLMASTRTRHGPLRARNEKLASEPS